MQFKMLILKIDYQSLVTRDARLYIHSTRNIY